LKIDKSTKVRRKGTDQIYLLTPKPDAYRMAYYLSSNDGIVPSGQMIYRTDEELDELFVAVT